MDTGRTSADHAATGTQQAVPPDLQIEEIHEADGIADPVRVLSGGFVFELESAERSSPLFDVRILADRRFRCWIGRAPNQAVCASAAFVEAGINEVAMVATLPAWRQRGYGEALTWPATLADPAPRRADRQ